LDASAVVRVDRHPGWVHDRPVRSEPAPADPTVALATAPGAVPDISPAPQPPAPPSPIAQLIALPGHVVNAVLQALDFTQSSHGYRSPIDFTPISEAIFAAFRGVEHVLGLSGQPVAAPVVPTLTYTGPNTGTTPTVAQFLNASAAEYAWGTVPGGLVPFTVNGFQMSYVNPLSGAVAQVWVTPQQQLVIAYQGTTGGTNLLIRPLIAITQLIADLQVMFTNTTPQAFRDSLTFAQQVQQAAAAQGYSADDIFLTGHSLGGWEAEYVAQQTGLGGIGFEGPGFNTTVPGNGADSMFVNIETYGDAAAYFSTDLPGSKPHYGSIVLIGDPDAVWPLQNVSALWGTGPIGGIVFLVDVLVNFFEYHLPGVQAYHLDVDPDPGVVPWLGSRRGTVLAGYGELTIPQLLQQASDDGILVQP